MPTVPDDGDDPVVSVASTHHDAPPVGPHAVPTDSDPDVVIDGVTAPVLPSVMLAVEDAPAAVAVIDPPNATRSAPADRPPITAISAPLTLRSP